MPVAAKNSMLAAVESLCPTPLAAGQRVSAALVTVKNSFVFAQAIDADPDIEDVFEMPQGICRRTEIRSCPELLGVIHLATCVPWESSLLCEIDKGASITAVSSTEGSGASSTGPSATMPISTAADDEDLCTQGGDWSPLQPERRWASVSDDGSSVADIFESESLPEPESCPFMGEEARLSVAPAIHDMEDASLDSLEQPLRQRPLLPSQRRRWGEPSRTPAERFLEDHRVATTLAATRPRCGYNPDQAPHVDVKKITNSSVRGRWRNNSSDVQTSLASPPPINSLRAALQHRGNGVLASLPVSRTCRNEVYHFSKQRTLATAADSSLHGVNSTRPCPR